MSDDWQQCWDARKAALERLLGPADDEVFHSLIPFGLCGDGALGGADVLRFRKYVDGIAYVTSDLIGCEGQIPNAFGSYELMICTGEEIEWAPNIISIAESITVGLTGVGPHSSIWVASRQTGWAW